MNINKLLMISVLFAGSQIFGSSTDAPKFPLHDAVREDNVEAITRLLLAGADKDARTRHGRTPLHIAALFGRVEIAQQLLLAGANMEAQDTFKGWTPLHCAAFNGSVGVAERLIGAGANIEAKDNDGETTLQCANNQSMVELLVARGAKNSCGENKRCHEAYTAAMKALGRENPTA